MVYTLTTSYKTHKPLTKITHDRIRHLSNVLPCLNLGCLGLVTIYCNIIIKNLLSDTTMKQTNREKKYLYEVS